MSLQDAMGIIEMREPAEGDDRAVTMHKHVTCVHPPTHHPSTAPDSPSESYSLLPVSDQTNPQSCTPYLPTPTPADAVQNRKANAAQPTSCCSSWCCCRPAQPSRSSNNSPHHHLAPVLTNQAPPAAQGRSVSVAPPSHCACSESSNRPRLPTAAEVTTVQVARPMMILRLTSPRQRMTSHSKR